MTELDVVVVNYHSGHALPDALAAVERFAAGRARVIIVDNSPDDGAVDAAVREHPDVVAIRSPGNVGFAAAVNRGLRAGTAPVVLLLNPDVSELRGNLGDVLARFGADPRLGAVAVRLCRDDGSLIRSCRREPRPFDLVSETLGLSTRLPRWQRPKRFQMQDWDYGGERHVDAATGACLFLRREALEDVGELDDRFFVYWEETDWLVRAKRRGWRTLYTPVVEAVHAEGGSSSSPHGDLSLLLLEAQYRYARKHFGAATTVALRSILAVFDLARYARRPQGTKRALLAKRLSVHVLDRTPGEDAVRPPADEAVAA